MSSPADIKAMFCNTQSIAFLPVTLFSMVMGLAGLAIAWERVFTGSTLAHGVSLTIGLFASALLLVLSIAYAWKTFRYPQEVIKELRHPLRLNFFPALSISLLLLSTFWLPQPTLSFALWSAGTLLQLALTLFVLNSWIHQEHFTVSNINPAWFIPAVGNIVVPLSGVPLGFPELSGFFFSVGLLYWLILLTIVFYRLFFHEPLPQPLTPTLFILLAPPSVGFLAYSSLIDGLDQGARLLYYCALFLALLLASNGARFWRTPFFLSSWAYSFPLAALSIATMKMGTLLDSMGLIWLARLCLTLLSLIVLWLLSKTIQAFHHGKVCIPEHSPPHPSSVIRKTP